MFAFLTDATLPAALADLTARDARLARSSPSTVRRRCGRGSRASRPSCASSSRSRCRWRRPRPRSTGCWPSQSPLTPERFLELDDATLKTAGFSRQKTRYGRVLAGAILSGSLDLDALDALDDEAVRAALTKVVGIGRWTADIYLLMALCRPDAWPAGDLALATAARHALGLAATPGTAELEAIGEAWRPWRAVAARGCWHFYLSGGTKKK